MELFMNDMFILYEQNIEKALQNIYLNGRAYFKRITFSLNTHSIINHTQAHRVLHFRLIQNQWEKSVEKLNKKEKPRKNLLNCSRNADQNSSFYTTTARYRLHSLNTLYRLTLMSKSSAIIGKLNGHCGDNCVVAERCTHVKLECFQLVSFYWNAPVVWWANMKSIKHYKAIIE